MVGICENDTGADIFQLAMFDRLDGSLGPHRHKYRSRDISVSGAEQTCPRARLRIGVL